MIDFRDRNEEAEKVRRTTFTTSESYQNLYYEITKLIPLDWDNTKQIYAKKLNKFMREKGNRNNLGNLQKKKK